MDKTREEILEEYTRNTKLATELQILLSLEQKNSFSFVTMEQIYKTLIGALHQNYWSSSEPMGNINAQVDAYETWKATDPNPYVFVEASSDKLKREVMLLVQDRLDTFAKTRNYDSIMSACTYATDPISKFAKEGQYCVSVRSMTWLTLYQFMDRVESGETPMPSSAEDVIAILPPLVWPE